MSSKLRSVLIGEFTWQRVVRSFFLIPVAVYLGIFLIGMFIPEKLIFRPPPPSYPDDEGILKIQTFDGGTIAARFYENPAAQHTILFSHGNAEDLGHTHRFLLTLRDLGFNVLAYDYRGYGRSSGRATEENSYNDITAAYEYLVENRGVPSDRVIVHGRSLGGAVAADLASRKPVGGLILESTFTSAGRVLFGFRILPFDKFETINKIGKVASPVLIIHGRLDRTISFHHGEKLLDVANEPKYHFWVDGAGHNDLFFTARDSYLAAIKDFADGL